MFLGVVGVALTAGGQDRLELAPTVVGGLNMLRLHLDRLTRFVGFHGDTVAFFLTG
jgi:hypothetical protein